MRVRPKSLFALAVLATVTSFAAAQTLTIAHVNLIDVTDGDVTGSTVRPDTTVTVEGNRVLSVGPSTAGHPQSGIVVDGRGQYLIPGLWDMHTHVYFDNTAADGTDLVLPLLLANGVTGGRDMGSELEAVLQARSEIAAHRLLGPRMVVSGPMLDGPKSTYKAAIAVATAGDGRNARDML